MRGEVEALRREIKAIETQGRSGHSVLATGAEALDKTLDGGLALGGVSEFVPTSFMDEPAVLSFALACAALALQHRPGDLVLVEDGSHARTWGRIYAPGLQALGIAPARVLLVSAPDAKALHACLEDAARTQGLAAVLGLAGPKAGFALAGARRVQLAAEQGRGPVFLVQSLRTQLFAPAHVRLSIAAAPCQPRRVGAPLPALGPPAWMIDLIRARNGARPQRFHLEYDHATHSLHQLAPLANRPAVPQQRVTWQPVANTG